ncbi:transcriptional regulator [Streptomyces buecherae]|uniref:Transcriptional regulator n=2 Tax=Streptomyces buecherae TaxID=2763006 RepID=A0A7H8NB47_9ACTN|nr:transcriptional regulator [Streptomyces buecherae]
MDPSRRSLLGAGGLFSVALTIPGWNEVVARAKSLKVNKRARVGESDVAMVSAMTDRLSDLDDEFGGRYARPMAAVFLSNTVAAYLKADANERVRTKMLSAASWLCYATGWMAVDEGLHGLAQSYYVRGLELAGASGDHMTYCHILRGMSVQAANLGHGAPAVRLANAAAEATPESTPRMKAFLSGQQAHAFALAGERANALMSLREAESAMDKAESPSKAFGGYGPSTVAYHTSEVRHALGDTAGSVQSLHDHFRLRDESDTTRTSLIFGTLLAERQLKVGHLEAACHSWNDVLERYPAMNSGRVDERVKMAASLLKPYRANALAQQTYDRALTLWTDKAQLS